MQDMTVRLYWIRLIGKLALPCCSGTMEYTKGSKSEFHSLHCGDFLHGISLKKDGATKVTWSYYLNSPV